MNLHKKRLIKSVSGFLAILVFVLPLSVFAAENNGKINQTSPTVSIDKGTQQNIIVNSADNKSINKNGNSDNSKTTQPDNSNKGKNKKPPQAGWSKVAKASLVALSQSLRSNALSNYNSYIVNNFGQTVANNIRSYSMYIADAIDGLCYWEDVVVQNIADEVTIALINAGLAQTAASSTGWAISKLIGLCKVNMKE